MERMANEIQFKVSSLGSESAALGAAHLVSERVLQSLFLDKLEVPIYPKLSFGRNKFIGAGSISSSKGAAHA